MQRSRVGWGKARSGEGWERARSGKGWQGSIQGVSGHGPDLGRVGEGPGKVGQHQTQVGWGKARSGEGVTRLDPGRVGQGPDLGGFRAKSGESGAMRDSGRVHGKVGSREGWVGRTLGRRDMARPRKGRVEAEPSETICTTNPVLSGGVQGGLKQRFKSPTLGGFGVRAPPLLAKTVKFLFPEMSIAWGSERVCGWSLTLTDGI